MDLLHEMAALGHGHRWSPELRRRYGGKTPDDIRAELGKPHRREGPVERFVESYDVGPGRLELTYQGDPVTGQYRLVDCYLL